ncbi:MAG: hypothetical protein U1C46_10075, partial [Bacteroidales bacterium]|nr:hypothetical protein [Bacteroidales bacterium]
MLTIDISGQKTGIIAGEGMWRWRLTNYARNNNHRAFDELLGKFVQYLSLREEKSRFRVSTRNTWNENESVEFAAEFYNASYEPVNENEVELTITDEEGRNFPFAFSPLGNSYFLNAGQLYPGNYIFGARTISQQEGYNAKGAFTVLPLQAELISTVADHNLLFGLAQRSGGQMVSPADMLGISQQLAEREDIKPLIYREMKYHELIDIGWLLALIIALLTGEWVLRRIAGGY